MKSLILFTLFSLLVFVTFTQVNPNHHYVNGYTRQDGTYVQGHYRTDPNSTNTDNYSTKPNVNPWTGKPGTIEPDNYNNTNYNSTPTYINTYPSYSTSTSVPYYSNSESSAEIKYHDRYSLDERRAIEQFLSDLELNTGLVDGIFTQSTIDAIEALQSIIGVYIDGKFGDNTINKIIEISNQ
jgi:hypothetical protein